MITPFKAMDFKPNEVVTKDDLDSAQNNLQWLLDNTPRGRFYTESGNPLDVRTVVICGRVYIGKDKKSDTATKSVRFGRGFAPACRPNITTGICSDGEREIFCIVNGPSGKLLPDSTGFEIRVTVPDTNKKDKWKIAKPFAVTWQAVGFRLDNIRDL